MLLPGPAGRPAVGSSWTMSPSGPAKPKSTRLCGIDARARRVSRPLIGAGDACTPRRPFFNCCSLTASTRWWCAKMSAARCIKMSRGSSPGDAAPRALSLRACWWWDVPAWTPGRRCRRPCAGFGPGNVCGETATRSPGRFPNQRLDLGHHAPVSPGSRRPRGPFRPPALDIENYGFNELVNEWQPITSQARPQRHRVLSARGLPRVQPLPRIPSP